MSVTTIRAKCRNLLGDNSASGKDIFTYTSSRVFSLSEEHISDVTTVYKNDTAIAESALGWQYSSSTNKVTIGSNITLTSGDTIQVDYSYYPKYSDSELLSYIQAAISYISIYNYKTFQYQSDDINPEPLENEENLIAIIVKVILDPDNKTIKLPDMSIIAPAKSMPTDEIIKQVIASFKKNCHGIFQIIDDTKLVI